MSEFGVTSFLMIDDVNVLRLILVSSQGGSVEDGLSVALMIGISARTTELNGSFRFL